MAKDQELLQAVKSNDLNAFRKIAAKIKAAKSSEYFCLDQLYKHLKKSFVIFNSGKLSLLVMNLSLYVLNVGHNSGLW